MARDRSDPEVPAIHRTRCVVMDVTRTLRTLGLHQMALGPNGTYESVALDPEQRRSLLVFLSELEEQVKVLEGFTAEIGREIAASSRRSNAAATYQRTGAVLRRFSGAGRPASRKVRS